LTNLIFIPVFFFILSPRNLGQDEGVSFHGDLYSIVFSRGFDKNYYHPGNFLLGAQYNFPASSLLEFNGGFDLLWVEPYGISSNSLVDAQVFIPFIFGGMALNFDELRIFGEIGYSLSSSANILGSDKGWVSSILDFNMESFQFGIKCPLYNALSLSISSRFYFGDKIKISNNLVSFSSVNLGLSYNLFSSEPTKPEILSETDEFKDKYYASEAENRSLYNQILTLHDSIKALNLSAVRVDTVVKYPDISYVPVKTLSVDSLNSAYNLHIGEPIDVKDFVNSKGLKEDGRLILGEYNRIASSYKGLPAGIYLICTVPELKPFTKNESEFPLIKFRSDPADKNKLIISIDINSTELYNKIKLKIK
jgi:hypothetical protein